LANNKLQEALYFLPIVLWRVANQALNVTREARVKLLGSAFDVTQRCAALYDGCDWSHSAHFGEKAFFWRRDDIDKILASLAVMGHIVTLRIPRIAINRIGTVDFEHLFGVTRVAERGNNHGQRIMRRLVKSNFLARIAEHWGLTLKRRRQRNSSGVYDGTLTDDEFLGLNDLFAGYNPAEVILQIVPWIGAVPDPSDAHPGFRTCHQDLAILLGRIRVGQKLSAVTCLGGTAIVARFQAINKIAGHTKLDWTGTHLGTLQGLLSHRMSVQDIASDFNATVPEIERGCKKLRKRGGESLDCGVLNITSHKIFL
jgi:hypothetical protein